MSERDLHDSLEGQLALHRVSDNAGGVKDLSSTLHRALGVERHFALLESSAIPTKARL
jgi:hypothetical protein